LTDPCDFADLVRQAFIDPIRSVLIVDDQYPTWEETLNEQRPEDSRDAVLHARSMDKKWRQSPDAPASVLEQFRKQQPALVIDIHDASTPVNDTGPNLTDAMVPAHLHQSDLLILDYNLEGSNTGLEGMLARSFLSAVLKNRHFNLVVIHTEEKDIQKVFRDCVLGLHTPCSEQFGQQDKDRINAMREQLDELSDEDVFSAADLDRYFDEKSYLELRHPSHNFSASIGQYMRPDAAGPLASMATWAEELASAIEKLESKKGKPDLRRRDRKTFALWAISEFERRKKKLLSDHSFAGLNWSSEEGRLWLRTGRGFVTFVKKEQIDLLSELQESLIAWQPTPSRLLSAMLRHEISCNGVEAEDRTLSKKHVFAYFYHQIRGASSEQGRSVLHRDQFRRQMEALAFQVEDSIAEFGEKIHQSDESSKWTYHTHYGVDLEKEGETNKALHHFNSYVSTLPIKPGQDQLDCGHIFKLENDWWVCATPACDLQPGQNSIAFTGKSENLRPFTALKLQLIPEELSQQEINSGEFCFVESPLGTIRCLGLKKPNGKIPNDGAESNADKTTWRTFIAKRDGRFTDSILEILVPKLSNEQLETIDKQAEIVGKLRYEYALNYVQKVGSSVTRIGLGYAS
jgi:hypothetical protein